MSGHIHSTSPGNRRSHLLAGHASRQRLSPAITIGGKNTVRRESFVLTLPGRNFPPPACILNVNVIRPDTRPCQREQLFASQLSKDGDSQDRPIAEVTDVRQQVL